jgi:hypothetical protein
MAALERYRNGERPGESDRIAWEFRDRMARKDRAIAEAFLAPFFDPPATAAEQLERWRHAWELDPNDDMTAAEYAQRVMIYNALLPQETARPGGLPWATLLLELLDRYCKTCPIWEQQEYTVVEAQARRGDADWIRAYFDRWDLWRTEAQDDDHVARPAYGSWLLAIAEGDEQSADETADKILEESRSAVAVDVGARVFPALSLPFVAVAAGRGLHGAEPIARWWREFPWSFLTERSSLFDRERGRHQEYRRTRDSLIAEERAKSNSWRGARQQVLEWAYYNEPESEETLDFLDSALTAQSREAEDAIDWATAACWRAQLRLHRGDAEGVFDTIRRLEEDPAYAPLAVSRTCAPFLRFLLARSHGGDVLPLALAVDSVASSVPIYGQWKNLIHNKLLRASNLVVARALREAGYVSDALASLRRRPDATGQGVVRGWIKNALGFTADYLREEGPLYAALGDTAMAIDRYEHYFRLRDERPDYEPWAAQWDSARAELEALRPPQ